MKKIHFLTVVVFSLLPFMEAQEKLPAALFGRTWDINAIEREVLAPNGIKAEKPRSWPAPEEYDRYAVIYLGETAPNGVNFEESREHLLRYVREGGVIILSGGAIYNLTGAKRNLKAAADLLGFDSCPKLDSTSCRGVEYGNSIYDWQLGSTTTVSGLAGAEVQARFRSDQAFPAMTVNRIGKGAVYWIGPMLFRVAQQYKSLGEADENGVFVLNREGKSLKALTQLYVYLFRQAPRLAVRELKNESSWGTIPLGAPGTLTYDHKFATRPEFRKPETPRPAFKLSENGVPLAEIAAPDKEARKLAGELKYHLDAITGGDFKIVGKHTPGRPAIVFAADNPEPEKVIVLTSEDTVTLAGNRSMAMYYLLEKLGCRYLWPGELGKVIPHEPTLYAPQLALNRAPILSMRRIRTVSPSSERSLIGLKNCGITDVEAFCGKYRSALVDNPGNGSFYAWHGQNSRDDYQWGHAFGDYYRKYGQTHPDYFAMQPNGSRSQDASPDRPRLCKSNPELAAQAAADCVAAFRGNPKLRGVSIALNDGGRSGFCMCEECRKLDPVNAPPETLRFLVYSVPRSVEYVALTDRVLTFSNRIAERVVQELPDRKLTMYAYSHYGAPPVKVKPHPALVIFCTAMNYTDDSERRRALKTLAAWSSFGNELFWRPNALWGFSQVVAPQNYARRMFDDTELLKANHLVGTDFDCNEQMWSCKGLIYYALSKALWNPDRMSYDDIVTDYCRNGFGKAAPAVMAYFRLLESGFDRAAATGVDYCEAFNAELLLRLKQCLENAIELESDPVIRRRIDFLQTGLAAGEYHQRMYVAQQKKDMAEFSKLQEEFRSFVRQAAEKYPLALYPGHIGFRTRYLRK